MKNHIALLKQLPAIDRLLQHPSLSQSSAPHCLVVEAAQETVEQCRQTILSAVEGQEIMIDPESLALQAATLLTTKLRASLCRVINATGTLLHTNLGRAPLSDEALENIDQVARGYSNLELNLTTGKRGHRYSHIDELLCRLTGAEAAAVVNNNAGAVLLSLTALAKGREAIVSRGELVEIGGAFRVPDVMEAGGVQLREIGTTNKTHLKDYRQAINENTGLLLKVHTSNYRIVGFTQSVSAAEMVDLGKEHKIPVMEDLGSGMLFDLSEFGLPREPTVREAIDAGIDLLTFSGDKLLGGPQAGLIVGKKWAIDKIRNHPLARALRIDKLTLAALETTLSHYLDRQQAIEKVPVLRMLNMSAEHLKERSEAFIVQLKARFDGDANIELIEEPSCVGGGALPMTELDGWGIAISFAKRSVDQYATLLRQAQIPVVARIQENRLIVNLRTVLPAQEPLLLDALTATYGA
nr:L-seryl-tRNA(Sec) selenium transferase [uncultured Desulfuromonas sp.]